jgi:hypothetical protein
MIKGCQDYSGGNDMLDPTANHDDDFGNPYQEYDR